MDRDALRKDGAVYTSCYCEENVYNLTKMLPRPERSAALFITNASKTVAVWHQMSGPKDPTKPIVWDYHVAFLRYDDVYRVWLVYDLDSKLPFPCSLEEYLDESFNEQERVTPAFRAQFRLIPGPAYLRWFASDRSHMRNEDGSWKSPPPKYGPICGPDALAAGLKHALPLLWDVAGGAGPATGRVVTDSATGAGASGAGAPVDRRPSDGPSTEATVTAAVVVPGTICPNVPSLVRAVDALPLQGITAPAKGRRKSVVGETVVPVPADEGAES